MNVLITGGAGYIGSITSKHLLDFGHQVTVFDNLEYGSIEAIDPRAQLVTGDLRQISTINQLLDRLRPEAILHFAAYALVGESMEHPELYWENNVCGGINLLNAAVQHRVRRFIFSSSCATYGNPTQLPITEETPQIPLNPYGESKLILEKTLHWMQQVHGLETVCLRYFNACGADQQLGEDHTPETHLIPNVLRTALGQQAAVPIFGTDFPTPDGTCIRDYIHVKDLAVAHRLALESNHTGAFNLGTGHGYSVREVIDMARLTTGRTIPTIEKPRRPGDPPILVASADRARQQLEWMPQYSDLSQIIQDAWCWHLAHPNGYTPDTHQRNSAPCAY
jgi:UDP-glucose 4-epimerase